jgi:diguanylate cyclase (GGDEF)-like protein
LGAIHFALRNYEQAMMYLQAGLELSRQNTSQLLELTFVSEISRIHQIEGNLNQAEAELLLALQTAEKINSLTNISLIHERLTGVYKERQEYKSALEHFEAFHIAFKKIFNDKSDQRVKNLEILHQVESARKQAELYRELAGTDSLTNLVNRRQFLEIAEVAIQRVKNGQGQLAIIMLDIDHFKNVNDQYGHKAGDQVLSAVATSIKQSLRPRDVPGRYGGDEFIILVNGASSDQCFKIAERIRRAAAQLSIPIGSGEVRVTTSLGLAWTNPERSIRLDDLINYADQALYAAKRQGRNSVVVWKDNEQSMEMGEIGKPG